MKYIMETVFCFHPTSAIAFKPENATQTTEHTRWWDHCFLEKLPKKQKQHFIAVVRVMTLLSYIHTIFFKSLHNIDHKNNKSPWECGGFILQVIYLAKVLELVTLITHINHTLTITLLILTVKHYPSDPYSTGWQWNLDGSSYCICHCKP